MLEVIEKMVWKATCEKCGKVWNPKTPNPVMCPYCHRRDWNKPKIGNK